MPAVELPEDEQISAVRCTRAQYFRHEIALVLSRMESGQDRKISLRKQAREMGIPESTLRYWIQHLQGHALEPEALAFFVSPAGVRFLHRQMTAQILVFGLMGGCGPSQQRFFLQMIGLNSLVACSDTTLRTQMRRLQDAVVSWGECTRSELAKTMPLRNVSLGVDETFFAKMVLVGMDVSAGFILLEKYSERRDAQTWQKAVESGKEGLKINVVQVVGDQAKALCALARDRLGVAKIEDLWHGQNAITRGTAGALVAKEEAARRELAKASEEREHVTKSKEEYLRQPGRGHPPNWSARETHAQKRVDAADSALTSATQHRDSLRQAVCELGNVLHPVDLKTGELQNAGKVEKELKGAFDKMDQVIQDAGLGERSQAAVNKARRLIPSWVASIKHWHEMVEANFSDLVLPAETLMLLKLVLIPLLYVNRIIGQANDTVKIKALQVIQKQLRAKLLDPQGLWRTLPTDLRRTLQAVAQDCVDLFQRSTGCVEGRNGVLSLHQHQMRGLNPKLLASLTVIHNFVIVRSDGSTAAMRFFGREPDQPLFEHLCQVLPPPARPRKRARQPKEDILGVGSA